MSCLSNFTLRSLQRNRARTAVSVFGIALSCALITAIFTTVSSISAGLYQRTIQTEGSWGIYASNIDADALSNLESSDHTPDIATYVELGSAGFSETERNSFGGYLTVKTMPVAEKGSFESDGAPLTLVPQIEEGRMPEKQGEIALPSILKGESLGDSSSGVMGKRISLGSEITLKLGERWIDDGETPARLDSTNSFIEEDEAENLGISTERLENIHEYSYEVVGFYNELGTFIGNDFTATGSGLIGITAPINPDEALRPDFANDGEPSPVIGAFASLKGFTSTSEINTFASEAGLDSYALHGNLLRYLGVSDGRAAYDSLYVFGATLALVIAAAGASLIYNSFSISVAERTRQFGMLASIGASKRQIRRTVMLEALVLGIIGIPLGIAMGLCGVAIVLSLTSEALGAAISLEGDVPFSADPVLLAGCGAFSFAILFASAWVPAMRASSVSAIDAIRQSRDIRLTKKALRRRERSASNPDNDEKRRRAHLDVDWANGILGAPAALAKRNKERASSRGRTVIASLAMSVLLLIACGSVKLYLDPFAGRVEDKTGGVADVTAAFNYTGGFLAEATGEDQSKFINAIDQFMEKAAETDGASPISVVKQGQSTAFVPARMLDDSARELYRETYATNSSEWVPAPFTQTDDYIRDITTFYLDDASFAKLAESVGLDASELDDPKHPKAIALNSYRGVTSDGRYFNTRGIAQTGTITLYDIQDDNADDEWEPWSLVESTEGDIQVLYLNRETTDTEIRMLQDDTPSIEVEVAAIADEVPEYMSTMSPDSHYPVVIMPRSVCDASAQNADSDMLGFSFANISFTAEDHATVTEKLSEIASSISYDGISIDVYDTAKEGESAKMLLSAIQLFVLLFSLITALVAIANVFNTLSNSIILRSREFAVLRSIGMCKQDFREMLTLECLGFAAKGFSIGLALGMAVTISMYYGASLSFSSVTFSLPWTYIGASLILTLAVLAASVIYALRKTRSSSIVEALKSDAG